IEARRLLLAILAEPHPASADAHIACAVEKVLVSEAFGTDVGSIAYNAFQVFGGLSFSAHDILEKYYRDSAEFLFLLGSDRALKGEIGQALAQEGIEALFPTTDETWLSTARERGPLAGVVERYRAGRGRLRESLDPARAA